MKIIILLDIEGWFVYFIYSLCGEIEGVLLEIVQGFVQFVFDCYDEVVLVFFLDMDEGQVVVVEVCLLLLLFKGQVEYMVCEFLVLKIVFSVLFGYCGWVVCFNYVWYGEINGVVFDSGDFFYFKFQGYVKFVFKVGDEVEVEGDVYWLVDGWGWVVEVVCVNGCLFFYY